MLLRHIRYFLAVAEHANFTRAAEALHVSQPTLSQQIRQLEDTLGVQLLDRSGRAVRLTEAGEAYMQYARLALQNLEAGRRALHDVHDLARGSLRLAMAPTFTTYLIGPLVDAFNRRYPAITLRIEEMPQERIEVLLNDDALDLGIAFDEVAFAGHRAAGHVRGKPGAGGRRVASPGAPCRAVGVQRVPGASAGAAERELCDAQARRPLLGGARHFAACRGRDQFGWRGGGDRAARAARHAAAAGGHARTQRPRAGQAQAGDAVAHHRVAAAQGRLPQRRRARLCGTGAGPRMARPCGRAQEVMRARLAPAMRIAAIEKTERFSKVDSDSWHRSRPRARGPGICQHLLPPGFAQAVNAVL
jgi:DNA-binding transcriptional LysR family regulator